MKKLINRALLLACFMTSSGNIAHAGDIITPEKWRAGDTNQLNLSEGQLCYGTPLNGNVSIPPYYYRVTSDYSGRDLQIVDRIIGSSHDGTWVQARSQTRNDSGWYYDGPFLNAAIDTLRLPKTITAIGRGAFENGTAKVLICDAVTPPSVDNPNQLSYPIFAAKLLVPTGSRDAYISHETWRMFSEIEEGAENYMPAQMVHDGDNWYELYNGTGTFVKGSGVIADEVSYNGNTYKVTAMCMASVDPYKTGSITINAYISDFNPNYHLSTSDSYFKQVYSKYKIYLDSINVSHSNPVFASIDGILYTKDYKQLLYFSRKHGTNYDKHIHVMPIVCESIATNGIPVSGYVSEMGNAAVISHKPLSEMCDGEVGCRFVVANKNNFPVIIGDTIRAIYSASEQCLDLHGYKTQNTDVIIPGSLTSYGVTLPIKTIGKYKLNLDYDYYDYFSSKGFEFGYFSSSTPVERVVFNPLKQAETAVIPENVEEIYNVFNGASNLKYVKLPQSLKVIGYQTFGSCKNLVSIELPSALERIENYAFSNCIKLSEIVIPATVSIIGPGAFLNCSSLDNIYCMRQTPPAILEIDDDPDLENYTFVRLFGNKKPTPSSCTLHVPVGSAELYRTAPVWGEFENIVEDAGLGIESTTTPVQPVSYYTIYGQKVKRQRGLNIVRYNDGTVKKVIIK